MKYTPSKLRKLAKENKLEVEHIIEATFERDQSIAIELESLTNELNWTEDNIVDGRRYVPYAKWVRFACIFIRDGYTGLVAAYDSDDDFSLAFLKSYKTTESIDSVLKIATKLAESTSPKSKHDIASSINRLLSFKGSPIIENEKIGQLRELLHSYYAQGLEEAEKATIYCALRGVGDQTSIDLINKQEKLKDPWLGIEAQVIKSIKKREKQNA